MCDCGNVIAAQWTESKGHRAVLGCGCVGVWAGVLFAADSAGCYRLLFSFGFLLLTKKMHVILRAREV